MSRQTKSKAEKKELNSETPMPVATAVVSKLPDGSTHYHFMGADSDVLGLLEAGKMVVVEKIRTNMLAAQASAEKSAES